MLALAITPKLYKNNRAPSTWNHQKSGLAEALKLGQPQIPGHLKTVGRAEIQNGLVPQPCVAIENQEGCPGCRATNPT